MTELLPYVTGALVAGVVTAAVLAARPRIPRRRSVGTLTLLDGRPREFALDVDVICRVERALGAPLWQLMAKGEPSLATLEELLFRALRRRGAWVTRRRVANLIDPSATQAYAEALQRALVDLHGARAP